MEEFESILNLPVPLAKQFFRIAEEKERPDELPFDLAVPSNIPEALDSFESFKRDRVRERILKKLFEERDRGSKFDLFFTRIKFYAEAGTQ